MKAIRSAALATYDKPSSSDEHDAITPNMSGLGVWRRGEVQPLCPDPAKRASCVRRKDPTGDRD